MEVGAVKQAFNNEVILLKKNLNQARIQVIHKLTRKAKTLTGKKSPEKLKEKLKKKAESAIKEVLIIKKIKPKDIAKFIVTHHGELQNYLNKPEVNEDKACARLLLHKSLQEKYKSIRDRFGNSSIEDLFMSRLERRKLKKEAIEKKKNKKKAKETQKSVNVEGAWEVEDIENNKINDRPLDNDENDEVDDVKSLASESAELGDEIDSSHLINEFDDNSEPEQEEINNREQQSNTSQSDGTEKEHSDEDEGIVKSAVINMHTPVVNDGHIEEKSIQLTKNGIKKRKDVNRNKNFNEKILKRKFNKEVDEQPVQKVKMADPFFITPTGESYMSIVEPRQPDEIKDIHKQGNRKYRRAVLFGHVPKPKQRKDDFKQDNKKIKNFSNSNDRFNNNYDHKQTNQFGPNINKTQESEKVEKLHPSWEAKKKKSGILPFEGKKIVFDDGE